MYSNGILVISNDDGLCVASRNMPWKSKVIFLFYSCFYLLHFGKTVSILIRCLSISLISPSLLTIGRLKSIHHP